MSSSGSGRDKRDPGAVIEVFSDGRITVDLGEEDGVDESTRLVIVESALPQ